MSVDVDQFLVWVLREHGPEVRDRVEAILRRQPVNPNRGPDAGAVLRQALIELHPGDFEFQPATDLLPYGFCSD